MVYRGGQERKWVSDTPCVSDEANDFPAVVDNKRITTLSGWSVGRIGPIYFLESATEEQKDAINYILLIDPGEKSEYTGGCNEHVDLTNDPVKRRYQSKLLADWLGRDPNNRLTILAGEVTYDESSRNGSYAHQGIQETLFAPNIRGNGDITDQVLVCNYSKFDHWDIFYEFADTMNQQPIISEDNCPRAKITTDESKFDGAWRP